MAWVDDEQVDSLSVQSLFCLIHVTPQSRYSLPQGPVSIHLPLNCSLPHLNPSHTIYLHSHHPPACLDPHRETSEFWTDTANSSATHTTATPGIKKNPSPFFGRQSIPGIGSAGSEPGVIRVASS